MILVDLIKKDQLLIDSFVLTLHNVEVLLLLLSCANGKGSTSSINARRL